MRERLEAVSGELAITSSLGRGTRVAASIPIPAQEL
jgi:signal transduction histidine kinase